MVLAVLADNLRLFQCCVLIAGDMKSSGEQYNSVNDLHSWHALQYVCLDIASVDLDILGKRLNMPAFPFYFSLFIPNPICSFCPIYVKSHFNKSGANCRLSNPC